MPKNIQYIEQSHLRLAAGLRGMAQAIWDNSHASDHHKQLAAEFWQDALDHERKARLFGDRFIAVR